MNKSNFKARMNWINLIREHRAEKAKWGILKSVTIFIPSKKLK